MITLVADTHIPYLKGVLEPYCEIRYLPGNKIRKKDLENADGLIIRTRTQANRSLLEGTPVQFIASATIGFDHIDTDFCNSNNIKWASTLESP